MNRKVLIVGGAGFIGSHMVAMLLDRGIQVVVLDDLSSGHRDAVLGGEFVEGDAGDADLVEPLMQDGQFDGVIHFASFIQVGESVRRPLKYYENNLAKTITLVQAVAKGKVPAFVFSSTAAVYGQPSQAPIGEGHPCQPISPYGRSKWMVEQVLADLAAAGEMQAIRLRYFNAAGADPDGRLGERHQPESHLIPLVLQAASGRRESVSVFGRDYDTPDGTCIRDYVHVTDLCSAHLLALERLWSGKAGGAFNLGNGTGFSVQEVIGAAERVTGRSVRVVDAPRREGDSARLVADCCRAVRELRWAPAYPEIETMLAHAWQWEMRQTVAG